MTCSIRALLIVSANDAARALAIDIAGGEQQFAELMNQQAAALGLAGTHAVNVTGLDADGPVLLGQRPDPAGRLPDGQPDVPADRAAHRRHAERPDVPGDQRPADEVPRAPTASRPGTRPRPGGASSPRRPATAGGSSSPCSARPPRRPATPPRRASSTGRSPSPDAVVASGMTEPVAERPYMPDYGVDTPDWSPLPWSWAAAKLAAGRNYWVVTASADGPAPRPAGVGRLGRRRAPLRLLVRAAVAQGRQPGGQPAGHRRRRRHGRVPVGRGPGARSSTAPARTCGSSATWRSTRRCRPTSAPTSCARTWSSSSCPSGPSRSSSGRTSSRTRATRWRFDAGSSETSSR